MICEMKKVHIVTDAARKGAALETMRKAGVIHVSGAAEAVSADASVERKRLSDIKAVCAMIRDCAALSDGKKANGTGRNAMMEAFADSDADGCIAACAELMAERMRLKAEISGIEALERELEFWGDFDPCLLDSVRRSGMSIAFAQAEGRSREALISSCDCVRLRDVSKTSSIFAVFPKEGELLPPDLRIMADYGQSLSQLARKASSHRERIARIEKSFASLVSRIGEFEAECKRIERRLELLSVSDAFSSSGSVEYVSGFIPSSEVESFLAQLKGHGEMGCCVCDPDGDDDPPTLLNNGPYSSMLKPVMGILGLSPGYRERDISFWFLTFFAVFFALIIGDAVYGLVFLGLGAFLSAKTKRVSEASALLMFLGACATVWGVMTGTYLGSELILDRVPFLRSLAVPAFTNFPAVFGLDPVFTQNSVMRLCFTIGAAQLLLACVMNVSGKSKSKDLSLFADVGWFLIILSLYFVVLYLLIAGRIESGILENHSAGVVTAIALGFAMIVVFGGQAPGKSFSQGLKSGLADLFTTFLNVVSSFGNIMSYIRLFAVGMASVAIAGSFNQIAESFYSGPLYIVAAVVLAIGHGLNLVMGILSVVVHGVRLNVMEFSNQLGLEWSGYEYHPFK